MTITLAEHARLAVESLAKTLGLCAGFGATAVLLFRRFQKDLRLDESTSLSRS